MIGVKETEQVSRQIVYAERTVKFEIEVPGDLTTDEAIARARRAIEEGTNEGILSYWDDEGMLGFEVEVLA